MRSDRFYSWYPFDGRVDTIADLPPSSIEVLNICTSFYDNFPFYISNLLLSSSEEL